MSPIDDEIERVLGVPRDADAQTVKDAYRRLARECHPDLHPNDPEAERRFNELNRVYAAWDTRTNSEPAPNDARANIDPADIEGIFRQFSDLFGGTLGRRGADRRQKLVVSHAEAQAGAWREVVVSRGMLCATCGGTGAQQGAQRPCGACEKGSTKKQMGMFLISTPCPECRGHGQIPLVPCRACDRGTLAATEKLRVKIPRGAARGQSLRVSGKGDELLGAPAGDLLLELDVLQKGAMTRRGDDVVVEALVKRWHLLFGGELNVPTLTGSTVVTVPRGVLDGATLTLTGIGYPRTAPTSGPYRGEAERGDQIVTFRASITPGQAVLQVVLAATLAAAAVCTYWLLMR